VESHAKPPDENGHASVTRQFGRWKIQWLWEVGAAAYNLVGMRSLSAAA